MRRLLFSLLLVGALLAIGARSLLGRTGSDAPGEPAVVATVRPTIAEQWVPAGHGLWTRCGDPGIRLYLADGERDPVGLLDDTCDPARRP